MNARNLKYIRAANKKAAVKRADDKLATKQTMLKAGLPTPELFGVMRTYEEMKAFDWDAMPNSFVLKPNEGYGGGGILVVFGRKKNGAWVSTESREFTEADFNTHSANILDGNFSLANTPDVAFLEERIRIAKVFKPYSYKGIPDIRVIVYNRVPIMAMLRLPTKESSGKANLHMGGIGVGIDIAEGITTNAILRDRIIEVTPDTRLPLRGIKIPTWKSILKISVEAQVASGLGYAGVDIAMDRDKGPMVLEVNARPGLSIQNANLAFLGDRLKRIKGLKINTVNKGVAVARELFGGEVEAEIEEISGRQVVGIIEHITLLGKEGTENKLDAKLDTGADSTSIDRGLARKLGYGNVLKIFDQHVLKAGHAADMEKQELADLREMLKKAHADLVGAVVVHSSHGTSFRPAIPLKFKLAGVTIETQATVMNREHLQYPMIIGKRDLKPFLVDPTK